MSVYFWKRGTTSAKYVMKARELKLLIMRAVANSNKKQYGVYGAGKLVDHVCEFYRHCVKANFIPQNENEIRIRYQFLILARQEFVNVVSQFADTSELMNFSDDILDQCSTIMYEEDKLLKGIVESDRKRYAKYLHK